MKFADPYILRFKQPKSKILFASSQLQGDRDRQEDYFINFNDECFAIADGVGGIPNAQEAAMFACETAMWGYKHIRLRPGYWKDKRLFIRRIFRSTNISLWQKQREMAYKDGMATTLLVCVIGVRTVWLGSVGDSRAYLYHDHRLIRLTEDDIDENGTLTKAVGVVRYGLMPQYVAKEFLVGDSLILVTDGVSRFMSDTDISNVVESVGVTAQSLSDAVVELFGKATRKGSTDNMTAILIKRVATEIH